MHKQIGRHTGRYTDGETGSQTDWENSHWADLCTKRTSCRGAWLSRAEQRGLGRSSSLSKLGPGALGNKRADGTGAQIDLLDVWRMVVVLNVQEGCRKVKLTWAFHLRLSSSSSSAGTANKDSGAQAGCSFRSQTRALVHARCRAVVHAGRWAAVEAHRR